MEIKKIKKIIAITIITISFLTILTGNSQATLQANPNTMYTKTNKEKNWIKEFRNMEIAGGAMGLSETLNSDGTSSSESNGIDVHMMKSTEYGAIAILSASGYGNPSNDRDITTTTGNNSGVILNTLCGEMLAGGFMYEFSIDRRYWDSYGSAKIGDALGDSTTTNPGAAGWHNAVYKSWPGSYSGNSYFIRGYYGIFSFSYAGTDATAYSRGVAVCGNGV